jgi:hypothetical protein
MPPSKPPVTKALAISVNEPITLPTLSATEELSSPKVLIKLVPADNEVVKPVKIETPFARPLANLLPILSVAESASFFNLRSLLACSSAAPEAVF